MSRPCGIDCSSPKPICRCCSAGSAGPACAGAWISSAAPPGGRGAGVGARGRAVGRGAALRGAEAGWAERRGPARGGRPLAGGEGGEGVGEGAGAGGGGEKGGDAFGGALARARADRPEELAT